MKFETPIMSISKFDVENIVTESVTSNDVKGYVQDAGGTLKLDNKQGTDLANVVAVTF